MKKIIAIVTIGASCAFLQVQAQNAPQTERTPDTQTTSMQSNSKRVKIDKSQLPLEVQKNLQEGEYKDMEIISVYEVTSDDGSTSYELVTDDTNTDAMDSTEVYPEGRASNDVDMDEEPTVVGDTIPDDASARVMDDVTEGEEVDTVTSDGIIDKAKDGIVGAYEEVKEFIVGEDEDTTAVQDNATVNTAPVASDTTAMTNPSMVEDTTAAESAVQETKETANEVEATVENTADTVGTVVDQAVQETEQETTEAANTVENETEQVVNEVQDEAQEASSQIDETTDNVSGEIEEAAQQTEEAAEEAAQQTEETVEEAAQEAAQEVDEAVDTEEKPNESAYAAPAEDQPKDMMSETETTDKTTATGVPVTAQAPQTQDDGMQTVAGDTTSTEELGEQLYDDNQYTTQHDAVESAYADMDEDADPSKMQNKQKKEYEIDVQGNNKNVKLYYNEQGELVKVDESDM